MQPRIASALRYRRRTARVRRGLAASAVLALAMTGCGSQGETGPGAASGASSTPSASSKPSGSPSAPESASTSAPAEDSGESSDAREEYLDVVRQAAEQEDQSVRTRVVSTLDTPQGPFETTVTGVTKVEDGKISARLDTELPQDAGGGNLRTLIVDGVFYVQAPGLPQGKYAKIDLAASGAPFGDQLQQQLDQIDPRAQAEVTIASVQTVEKLGESTVNGVDVVQYRVTQDFEKFAQQQDNQLFDQLLQTGVAPKQLTSIVSIDDQGRVRRTELDLDVQGNAVKTVADFLAYDIDVDIQAPPKSKVVTMPMGG